jgi:hypothetical protein
MTTDLRGRRTSIQRRGNKHGKERSEMNEVRRSTCASAGLTSLGKFSAVPEVKVGLLHGWMEGSEEVIDEDNSVTSSDAGVITGLIGP